MNSSTLNGATLNGAGQTEHAFEVSGPAIISLQAFTPSRRWSIPSSRIAQIIYLCNLGDLDLSITSFQARLRDGRPTYLSVVVTADDGLLDEIQSRTDQQLVVRSGVRTAAGEEITEPLVTPDFDSVRCTLGGRSGSYTLVGYVTETTVVSKVERMTGVVSYGLQGNGKRTLRCEPSFFLRPGDVARVDGHQDLIVGMISIAVNPRSATMDLTER